MTLPILITPERVQEIAHSVHINANRAEAAVYLAMPEIAAAALKWAAEQFELPKGRKTFIPSDEVVDALRQLAKEIKYAK